MTYNEIIENLYIGDLNDVSLFRHDHPDAKILCVLDYMLPKEVPQNAYWIPILRSINGELRIIEKNKGLAMGLIHGLLISGEKILVHCGAGMERSPLIVACFIKEYHNKTLDEAYKIVKEKRKQTMDRREWL